MLKVKYLRKSSCHYSLGFKVLGRSFLISHSQYDIATSIALGIFTLFAPVTAVALGA